MKLLHTQRINRLEEMFRQVRGLNLDLLLSGLTILVKDTATFLTAYGLDDEMAEGFRLAYLDMLSDNRYYWEKFGPDLYLPLKEAGLPHKVVTSAANCEVNLRPLTEIDEDTEWLRAPGWHFLKTYSGQRKNDILRGISLEELKDAFCEGKDPYENESEDSCFCESKDPYKPIEGVVGRLAGTDREFKIFWYPVMLYLALLFRETNFTTLE